MGVGAGLSMYVVVVQKFTFAISSPDEFLFSLSLTLVDDIIYIVAFYRSTPLILVKLRGQLANWSTGAVVASYYAY